jgi:2-dehydropantoate 2-reductase
MAALKLKVASLPGTPVGLLAFGVRTLPLPLLRPLMLKAVGSGRGGKMPSLHIDLHSGRGRSEVAALNGAVARSGARCGVETPVNRWLAETLQALVEGRLDLHTYAQKPEEFLTQLGLS